MHVGHRTYATMEMCRAFELEPESGFYAEELRRLVRKAACIYVFEAFGNFPQFACRDGKSRASFMLAGSPLAWPWPFLSGALPALARASQDRKSVV